MAHPGSSTRDDTILQQNLEEQLQAARDELAQLTERLQAKGDYGLGKGDPMIVRWELNLARRERIEDRIAQLEDALHRLDEGTYGICESCGQPISVERMAALPRATLCIDCARSVDEHPQR
jgi:RNA polymerase-binding protein DksA